MKQISFDKLICPLDGLPLVKIDNSAGCSSGHNYDYDRKGTLNLLPVQFRKSKNPGDSKEMIAARTAFLNAGFYQPISDKLNELLEVNSEDFTVFDAGCGEGYYTERMAVYLKDNNSSGEFSVIGMDISKPAIIASSRRDKVISWIVGTNANIPVAANSIDVVLCLFGFPVWDEFKRILKPNAKVILVESAPNHLIELRRVLYPEIKEKIGEKITPEGFVENSHTRLTVAIKPPSPQLLKSQIMMTPHGFRSTAEKIEEAALFSYDKITLDVFFSVYDVIVTA